MSIINRNGWKYYDFWWRGERYQGACRTRNARVAEQIENAKKTELALGRRPTSRTPASSMKTCIRHCYVSSPWPKRAWTKSMRIS